MKRFLGLGLGMASILFVVGTLNAKSDTAELCRAAYVGDTATVRRLLDSGVDPNGTAYNYQFWRGLTLKYGDIRCFDCNVKRCSPAIVQAAKGSHLESEKLLLERGAEVRGDNGRFAMTYTNRMLVGAARPYLATPQDMANAGKIKGLLAKYGVPAPPE